MLHDVKPKRAGARSSSIRRVTMSAVGIAALLPVTACTAGPEDEINATLQQLAGALSSHTLDGVPLAEPRGAATFAELVEPLADYDVAVSASDVVVEDGVGTATLDWNWQVEGHDWAYQTPATVIESDEGWVIDWTLASFIPDFTPGEEIVVERVPQDRAPILGPDGTEIVTERPVIRYGLDKTRVDESEVAAAAEAIAGLVGIDPQPYVEQALAMGPEAFVVAITLREDQSLGDATPQFDAIPGAIRIEDQLLLAPSRDFARELLGTVGPATAEIIESSDGAIHEGDTVGLGGLQLAYDEQLRGQPSTTIRGVAGESAGNVLASFNDQPGTPLTLTLDERLQLAAESVIASEDPEASATAIVAIRPSSGEVLAVANGPGDTWNFATEGQYAPGSTFKLVTALAMLRSGVQPGDTLHCAESVTVDGYTFENYDDYPAAGIGDITFEQAIANSCNTALIAARDRVDDVALASAAEALGLGASHDLGYPAYLGQVPTPETETERAAALIGQGRVLASPLAMATVVASVGAGHTVVPTLIDGKTATAEPAQPLTADEAQALQGLMRAVVTGGSATFLQSVTGDPVGAKTGTAEHGEAEEGGDLPTHAWMVATQGDLAVAVFVEAGESGAETAGPLLQAFLEAQ